MPQPKANNTSANNSSAHATQSNWSASDNNNLDLVFHALSHRVRRAQIALLAESPRMVKELADPFDMSLPAASKHLKVLEHAGLMKREIHGRSHRCTLNAEHLHLIQTWLQKYQVFWADSLTSLANYAEKNLDQQNKSGGK